MTGASAVRAGNDVTCVLMPSGGIRCWGDNTGGEFGTYSLGLVAVCFNCDVHMPYVHAGVFNITTPAYYYTPPSFDFFTGLQAIGAAGEVVCTLTTAGGASCWGHNSFGQCGKLSTLSGSVNAQTFSE